MNAEVQYHPSEKPSERSSVMSSIPFPLTLFICGTLVYQPATALWGKKNWRVEGQGRVTCNGQPMPYVEVWLMDDDVLLDDKMGSTTSNSQGYFKVSGTGRDSLNGKPDPYIRVIYKYSGTYGKMEVEKSFGFNQKEKSRIKPYSPKINFGTINFNSIHCKCYVQFYRALKDFYIRTGRKPPYETLHIRSSAIIHGGTAYATTNVIRIPRKSKSISYETTKHELAHTVRQSYDGSMLHFLKDAVKYKYPQIHYCGKKTNEGFAFNDGWAEFWAGSCTGGPYGGSATDYRYEGNVAGALRRLRKKCNSSDGKMVDVLRRSGNKKIHSFSKYNSQHGVFYGCHL